MPEIIQKPVFERKLLAYLKEWKNNPGRKPLIIRGARQVGKSTLVREFAREYRYFIELNLESPSDRNLFERITEIGDMINAIFLRAGIQPGNEPVLIFIDEIQESPAAIGMLRYFYEVYPQFHVVAAGSLLEFAMKRIASFPVGRVEQVVLHPFDFDEFLLAAGKNDLVKEISNIPLNAYAFGPLIEHFHDYAIIGGMPEVISNYILESSFLKLPQIYSNLWQSFRDDVEKYASNSTERKIIRHIIDSAPFEKERITLNGFGNSAYRSREVGEALRSLDSARIIQIVYPSTSVSPPLTQNLRRKPRLQFLDTGLLNYTAGFQPEMICLKDLNVFQRGRIIQHLAAQQVQAQNNNPQYRPLFWVREEANSNAEVDLLIQEGNYLIPVEVKSGKQGYLRSLHEFIDRCNHCYGIRLLGNSFSVEKVKTPGGKPYYLMNLPYFLSHRITDYAKWLIRNYK